MVYCISVNAFLMFLDGGFFLVGVGKVRVVFRPFFDALKFRNESGTSAPPGLRRTLSFGSGRRERVAADQGDERKVLPTLSALSTDPLPLPPRPLFSPARASGKVLPIG